MSIHPLCLSCFDTVLDNTQDEMYLPLETERLNENPICEFLKLDFVELNKLPIMSYTVMLKLKMIYKIKNMIFHIMILLEDCTNDAYGCYMYYYILDK